MEISVAGIFFGSPRSPDGSLDVGHRGVTIFSSGPANPAHHPAHRPLPPVKRSDGLSRTPWWRIAISVFIIGHLWAVIGRPLEFATQGPTGPSPAGSLFYAPIRAYSEAAYLNHGYAFFAPNPGPSHLIRVEVPSEEGETETYLYPDLERQWPRLLYHRHFMLTEFFHNTYQPAQMPEEVVENRALAERWALDRQRHEAIRGSLRRRLQQVHETDQLTIHRVEHRLAGLPEFLSEQLRLDDPQLYIDLPDDNPEYRSQLRNDAPPLVPRFGAPSPQNESRGPRGNFPGSGR